MILVLEFRRILLVLEFAIWPDTISSSMIAFIVQGKIPILLIYESLALVLTVNGRGGYVYFHLMLASCDLLPYLNIRVKQKKNGEIHGQM
jgi:hypothetical protein